MSGTVFETWWQQMLQNYTETQISTVGTFLVHEILYFLVYVPFFVADQIPAFRKYKIQPKVVNTWEIQWRCLKRLIFNHIVIQLPMILISHPILEFFGLRIDAPLPSFPLIFFKCCLFLIVEDFYFYWIHRLLHHKSLYKHIHKIHHDHPAPHGIAAEYAHFVETLFLGLGTVLGPFLFARHLFTLWCWLAVRLFQTVEAHVGYDFPWSPRHFIPFWGGALYHDYHHEKFLGNYASTFTYCDWLFGTDTRYYQTAEAREKERQAFLAQTDKKQQ
mmetsp:Transcript_34768/g.87429  ORF Transcript_34768/g.87429 Transcript_34768/m.87429 type:complete len:274 (-) Transcript_34768:1135-1956(-)|eukprot:CAMPEP_0177642664 /NCGR_PEP_ID=MMETSP0447-20121125/7716_1 /TAXON_ID=0 /ORGANISM="Stygamoeba regulata, Strain BSH-02190019" /LENGTH=273 /DNA_ID=CAMNT_0019144855 /DNA_START=57 /DNA_END=878 /DNA_ORIENTATION=-